jgi:hypothetical protein
MQYKRRQLATATAGVLLGLLLFGSTLSAQTGGNSPVDRETGLKQAAGWQVVRNTCTRCHTAQIITSNSGNRAVWESRIRWMQNSQGLGELSPDTEDQILSYLATHYGQKDSTRRQPLPASLMPSNPFAVNRQ